MTNNVISLTQFMDFSTKKSPEARMKAVKDIKYKADYHPSIDYWKKLRDEIKRLHEKNLPIENLKHLLLAIPEDDTSRLANYRKNINAYIHFVNKNQVEYFQTGKAIWTFDDNLSVRANPELGLIINGTPYLLKNHYKKTDSTVSQRTIKTSLTAMQLASSEYVKPDGVKYAVLNLQNRKLYESEALTSDSITLLESEALQFSYLWGKL